MPGDHRVFISYSHHDAPFAARIHAWLRREGIACWYDSNMPPGELTDHIVQGIHQSEIFLVLVSPASISSRWVMDELSIARSNQRLIVPLVIQPIPLASLGGVWEVLRSTTKFFEFAGENAADSRRLLAGIRDVLGRAAVVAPAAPAARALPGVAHPDAPLKRAPDAPTARHAPRLRWLGAALVLALAAGASFLPWARWLHRPLRPVEYRVERELLGPIHPVISHTVAAPDGRHFAYLAPQNGRWVAVLDGRTGPECDEISGPPTLSPRGNHIAYAARVDRHQRVYVDGRPGPVVPAVNEGSIVFSPDGERLAYCISMPGKVAVVVDDAMGALHDGVLQRLMFTNDGKRLGYVATDGATSAVVVDGQAERSFDAIGNDSPVFSSDGRRVAYAARSGGGWVIVIDGLASQSFDAVEASSPIFSSDGAHVAYVAKTGQQWALFVDGLRKTEAEHMGACIFGSGSQHVAVIASEGTRAFVIVDGRRGPSFEGVHSFTFHPDGKRFAYVAQHGEREFTVIDGRRGPEYDRVVAIHFSPDGRHVAYLARSGALWSLVLDGDSGAGYSAAGFVTFSPDSRSAAYWVQRGNKELAVVGGSAGPALDEILALGFEFDAAGVLEYVARDGQDLLRLRHVPERTRR